MQRDVVALEEPPDNIDEAYIAHVNRLAVFAQDDLTLGKEWSAYAGVRWEGIELQTSSNEFTPIASRFSVVSPVAQLLWKVPSPFHDQVRVGIARTYKPPTPFDLIPRRYVTLNNTPLSPDAQGNPNLVPELAWGVDVSGVHHWSEDGSIELAATARWINNVIHSSLSNEVGTWVSTKENDGSATALSLEARVQGDLRDLSAVLPAVTLSGSVTWNSSVVHAVQRANNRLDDQPPLAATIEASYSIASW